MFLKWREKGFSLSRAKWRIEKRSVASAETIENWSVPSTHALVYLLQKLWQVHVFCGKSHILFYNLFDDESCHKIMLYVPVLKSNFMNFFLLNSLLNGHSDYVPGVSARPKFTDFWPKYKFKNSEHAYVYIHMYIIDGVRFN